MDGRNYKRPLSCLVDIGHEVGEGWGRLGKSIKKGKIGTKRMKLNICEK